MTKAKLTEMELNINTLQTDVKYIKDKLDEIFDRLDNKYVSKDELAPIKALVYGFAGIVFASVIGSLVYLVIK